MLCALYFIFNYRNQISGKGEKMLAYSFIILDCHIGLVTKIRLESGTVNIALLLELLKEERVTSNIN